MPLVKQQVFAGLSEESDASNESLPFQPPRSDTASSNNPNNQNLMVRPPVLVECPACQTKFTVSRAAISNTASPVFHCSRCDFVFSRASNELTEVALKPQQSQTAVGTRSSLRSLQSSTGTFPINNQVTSHSVTSDPFSPISSRDLEKRQLPLSFDGSATQEQSQYSSNMSGSTFNGNAAPDFTARSVTLPNLGEVKSSPLPDHSQAVPSESSSTSQPSFKKLSSVIASKISALTFSALRSSATTNLEHSSESHYSVNTITQAIPEFTRTVARRLPMAALIVPMVSCLILLSVVSWLSIAVPSLGTWMSHMWIARSELNLGHGLVMRGVKYSKVTLENGTQMGVISGSVYNGSGASIERATLEGVIFGRRGEELVRVKTGLGNKLNQARISSLTSDMIRDLQSEKKTRNIAVRPGEGYPFVIALPLPTGQLATGSLPATGARTFSVRILNAK